MTSRTDERLDIEEIVECAAWKLCALENEVWDETDDSFKARYRREAAQLLAPSRVAQTIGLALSSLEASPAPVSEEMALLRDFANSFHFTVVEESFYKDVTLHLDNPHALSIRIRNDSSKSWLFKDLEDRRRAALAAKGGQ